MQIKNFITYKIFLKNLVIHSKISLLIPWHISFQAYIYVSKVWVCLSWSRMYHENVNPKSFYLVKIDCVSVEMSIRIYWILPWVMSSVATKNVNWLIWWCLFTNTWSWQHADNHRHCKPPAKGPVKSCFCFLHNTPIILPQDKDP